MEFLTRPEKIPRLAHAGRGLARYPCCVHQGELAGSSERNQRYPRIAFLTSSKHPKADATAPPSGALTQSWVDFVRRPAGQESDSQGARWTLDCVVDGPTACIGFGVYGSSRFWGLAASWPARHQ